MTFDRPGFLLAALLAVPVLLAAWRSRAPLPRLRLRVVAALQALAVVAAAVALAGPWRAGHGAAHRVVVWAGSAGAGNRAAIAALRDATPRSDGFRVVHAGAFPAVGEPGAVALPAATGAPDLAAALRAAAAAIPAGARGGIVLCADGSHDGASLAAVANELAARGILVCLRPLPRTQPDGDAVLALRHPPRVAPGEAFRIEVTVRGAAGPARLEAFAQGVRVGEHDVVLGTGEQVRTVDAVVPGGARGLVELDVHLVRGDTPPAAGTRERTAVLADATLTVLHLAGDESRRQALADTLAPHGVETLAPADPAAAFLDGRLLSRAQVVLVDDLAAPAWAAGHAAVRDACLADGTGLVLAGTHHNLGPGGYATTPLAELLPVRMPQREERRDPSVSLVLIVDTSGSMGGGRLELAKEVARLAIQKLQPHDKAGLIEFHGSKRWAAPLQPATNTIELTRALNRLQVGGGTIIFDALEESYFALLNARTRFQHVLVLTDGGVESGPFENLARRMAAAGQTVSTVLIGPQANSPFLLSLAQWGRGRFYGCPDKFQMPDLQFREPQTALLPAVQERELALRRTAQAEATAAFAGDQLPPAGAFVEADVRRSAEVLLRGVAGEPYLVGWDQGAGRVLVLAGQALGPQSGALHDDPGYGAFLADLLRSAASGATSRMPRLELEAQERGVRVRLLLPHGAALGSPPTATLRGDTADDGEPAATLAGTGLRYDGFLPWTDAAPHVVEVRAGDVLLAAGGTCAPRPRAGRTSDHGVELIELAHATGGSVSAEGPLPQAVGAGPAGHGPRGQGPADQVVELVRPFALAALVLFVLGLLLRRLPWREGTAGRAAAAALTAFVLGAGGVGAQDPAIPPADEGAVRAAITAELAARGDLDGLAARWQTAPALHRYWLARASGDLARAASLCGDPSLAESHRDVRVRILDVLGRPREALAALGEPDAGLSPEERGAFHLRRAWLHLALGEREATERELEAAVTAAANPTFTQQAGVLAASFGFLEAGLRWHSVDDEPGRDTFQAALRRGLWQTRAGRPEHAAAEYATALARAPLQRDRVFALAMLVAAHRAAGDLPALADAWLARARGEGEPLQTAELQALAEVLRELGRARDGLRLLAALPPDQRAALGELPLTLAVEAGEADAAIARLREDLRARPTDVNARCSLALLLADLQRDAEALDVLDAGIEEATPSSLRALCAAASELGQDEVVGRIAAAFARSSGEGAEVEAALLEAAHLRRHGKTEAAAERLLRARERAVRAPDRLRLAEQLESLGRRAEAIALYDAIWEETRTEDVGMRLAWMLSDAKTPADRARAQAIFRQVWTSAGSAARRVQAEEHVLDLAAREGNLADLALELEERLADPATPNRPAVRDALVKIYTRARDTTGAVAILEEWAKDEPERRVEALAQLARVHLAAEEFRNHERVLQRLIEIDPEGELEYRQQLAMSALERGRPLDARRHVQGLLDGAEAPDSVALEFAAGIYALAAMHEESVRLYRRALALHPERVETFLLLGNALRAAGQRDAAVGTFQELLLQPLPDDLFVVAVDGLLNMEASAPVLAAAARAVRLRLAARPEQVFLHRVLQDLLEAQRDEAGRLRALEDTVVAAGEQRTNFVRELMQEAEVKRDWRTYAAHGRTLLLLGEEVPPAVYLSLGEALLHLGDVDAAARSFARARLGTDFASVEARTAELYENAGRLAEAERIRVRLLRRSPDDPMAIAAVARLAERQGALARALPQWLGAARRLLDEALDAPPPASGRRVVNRNREKPDASFAEAFAGVLRCAPTADQLTDLSATIAAAAADGPIARRLAAAALLRHLSRAYPDSDLPGRLRIAEEALLADGDPAAARAIRASRLRAGDLAGAQAIAASGDVNADDLRLLCLAGEPVALAEAAARARPQLLPDLARNLLLAQREDEARALFALVRDDEGDAARSARRELGALLAIPVPDDPARTRQRLDQALARSGALATKIVQVFAALRELPDLPAQERADCVQQLAREVIAGKDAAAADRLLSTAGDELPAETATELVELTFAGLDRGFQIQTRAQNLRFVPPERGVALVRGALRRFRDDAKRQLTLILANPQVPEPVVLDLVGDLDPNDLQGTDRTLFVSNLERTQQRPAVLAALAARWTAVRPDDTLTGWLRARVADTRQAQQDLAKTALLRLAARRVGDEDARLVEPLVRLLAPDTAETALGALPNNAPPTVRAALAQRCGDMDAAGAALLAAHEERPEDLPRIYAAANFFEGREQFDVAARLYRTLRATSGTFYPYQAQQLARLELLAGNAEAALEALRSARDPGQTNFRLTLRVLAELDDAGARQAALAELLQARAARAGANPLAMLVTRTALRSTGGTDRLAAVLAPPRLPGLAPKSLDEAEDAPSDFDLLAFLPEGESAARTLLRTLDEEARDAEPGVYRGLLGAAARAGRAGPLLEQAVATLATEPYDAESLRLVLAAAEVGLDVPRPLLQRALQQVASEGRLRPATIGSLIGLAETTGDTALAERVLRMLLVQRSVLADRQLRPWMPALYARACQQLPDLALQFAREAPLDAGAEAELTAALVLYHPDPAAAANALREREVAPPERAVVLAVGRDGADRLPSCGLELLRGDVEAAIRTLEGAGTLWPEPRALAAHRLASAVPPLERWAKPEQAQDLAARLLALAAGDDGDRQAVVVRLAAVLAARLAAAGRADEAAALRQKLREIAVGWRPDDWLTD